MVSVESGTMSDSKNIELLCVQGEGGLRSYTLTPLTAREFGVTPGWVHIPGGQLLSLVCIATQLLGQTFVGQIVVYDYIRGSAHLIPVDMETSEPFQRLSRVLKARDEAHSQEEVPLPEEVEVARKFLLDEDEKLSLESIHGEKVSDFVEEELRDIQWRMEGVTESPPSKNATQEAQEINVNDLDLEAMWPTAPDIKDPQTQVGHVFRDCNAALTGHTIPMSSGYHASGPPNTPLKKGEFFVELPTEAPPSPSSHYPIRGFAQRRVEAEREAFSWQDQEYEASEPEEEPNFSNLGTQVLELVLYTGESWAYTTTPATRSWILKDLENVIETLRKEAQEKLSQWVNCGSLVTAVQELTGFSVEKISTLDIRVRVVNFA